jgi:hypothetical protein
VTAVGVLGLEHLACAYTFPDFQCGSLIALPLRYQ